MADIPNQNQDKDYCPVYKDLGLYEDMSRVRRIERTEAKIGRTITVSLYSGDDLVPIVKRICLEEGIRGGFVSAIGAADRIPIAAFNLETGNYDQIVKTGYHEVMSIEGNVSTILDDNRNATDLMIHLHIAFADTKGNAFGGHLLPGFSSAAVGEVFIKEVIGGMYRFQSEIDQQGYSTIKFNIPLNKDLIPLCREDAEMDNLKNIKNEKLIRKITEDVLRDLNKSSINMTNWDSVEEIDIIIGEFRKGEKLKIHYHKPPTDEIYYILEGEAEVTMEDKKITARKGDILYIPHGMVHWPVNLKEEVCRILFILSPPEKEPPVVVK